MGYNFCFIKTVLTPIINPKIKLHITFHTCLLTVCEVIDPKLRQTIYKTLVKEIYLDKED